MKNEKKYFIRKRDGGIYLREGEERNIGHGCFV